MYLLQYDPYSQTAEVRNLRSDGTATDFDNIYKKDADALRRLEKDIILQNRIEALIRVLKNISASKKIDIRFIGTKKDYRDLEEGIKRLKKQGMLDSESKLEKAETPFFHEPDYIREQLHEISEDVSRSVEHLRAEYPETGEQLQFDDVGFKDVLNERTPLVLVGSGSHGKSYEYIGSYSDSTLPLTANEDAEFIWNSMQMAMMRSWASEYYEPEPEPEPVQEELSLDEILSIWRVEMTSQISSWKKQVNNGVEYRSQIDNTSYNTLFPNYEYSETMVTIKTKVNYWYRYVGGDPSGYVNSTVKIDKYTGEIISSYIG